MAFLSDILDRTVTDLDGNYIGKLNDLVVRELAGFAHPLVEAVVVRSRTEEKIISYKEVMSLFAPTILLRCHVEDVPTYVPTEDEVFLSRDVLDKQIIDTDGARVVRVNDLELVRVSGVLYVSNVDIGMMGVLRRMGLATPTRSVAATLHLPLPQNVISWDNVELLRHDQFMRLRVPAEEITKLHPADVAEILSDLNRLESGELLESLPVEHLADTLEQVEPEFQVSLLERMSDEKVADVLEEMQPDDAADLLAALDPERSEGLLALMNKEEAADVRTLLAYPENTAGGIMTTEFAYVPADLTAEQAIRFLRENAVDAEAVFYVCVTDAGKHLLGVFSLNKLIFSDPQALVSDFMETRVKLVQLLDEQDEVAQMITKYDLLALPVVDEENVIHGIVTADDALDKIIPTAWKKRLPRFYR